MAEISVLIKVSLVLLGLGVVTHLVGFAAPYWHDQQISIRGSRMAINYGLWTMCMEREVRYHQVESCHSMVTGSNAQDYIRATQFFETVGFLTGVASVIILLLQVCTASCRDRRILPILAGVAALVAAGCIILGCIIFGAKDNESPYLSWAFAFTIVGGLFFGVAGIIIFISTFVVKR